MQVISTHYKCKCLLFSKTIPEFENNLQIGCSIIIQFIFREEETNFFFEGIRRCSQLASFLTRKSWQERFFNEKQSWQRLLQIAAESVFCCHSNSCNSSLALCVAEMSRKSKKLAVALAFEVNGKLNVDSQRRLSAGTFTIFFLLLWKRQISLLAYHWSAVKKALDVGRFFQKSWTFLNSKKRSELQKKTPAVAF